jgi:hypothetical protein
MAFDVVSAIAIVQGASAIIREIQAQARLAHDANEISDVDLNVLETSFDKQSDLWDAEVAAAKARIKARTGP